MSRWDELERLAKAAAERGMHEDVIFARARYREAANPAAILELIAAARQQPNREG